MNFVYAPPENAASAIAEAVNNHLKKGPVLLLVSGGSNIQLAANVSKKLTITNTLTVGLIDERYGPVNHPNSNWTQLLEAGFITDNIELLPIMHDERPIEATCADYKARLQAAVTRAKTVIAIFGIGIDGHTAGILPDSPALEANSIVAHYIGSDFPRITTTPLFMPNIDIAFLVSYNPNKHEQLALLNKDLPISQQPAQVLKRIKNLIVYSDYRGIGQS